MKHKAIAMLSLTLFIAAPLAAQARDLGEDMDILNANYSAVMKSDNPAALKKGLAGMHEAALDARKGTPPKLKGQPADSPQMKDFRQGIDTLIGQIEQAQALADKGDTQQAQTLAKQFQQTRNENHAKFR
ncbi:cytochrome b562 [Acerihabitans arboris]|uniref:Cytochrome b562 n=1 Tax=Acerihabitans arboris TaxID=2691583 RepID=A0A845SHZ0_9GAMM|nr:cytochrome b562 [Acerihabitans arboris]NDL63519.1 cytochrome b562 [Acerihabitans arboris]